MPTPVDPYVCGYCNKPYPVTIMARDCEAAHEAEATPCAQTRQPQSSPNSAT